MALAAPSFKQNRPRLQAPWLSVVVALATLTATAPVVQHAFALSGLYALKVLAAFAVAGVAVAWFAERHLGARAFGAANQLTLARAAVVALLAGLLGEAPEPTLAWFVTVAGLAVLMLDGIDGRLARVRGTVSRFGARFDMETDALLALVLALLVLQFDKAGGIVLAAGFMRYAFAAAGAAVPRLRRPLPPSRRRQTVCVVQIAALALCLVPWVARPISDMLAITAVVAVCGSFAVDLRWLVRAGPVARR